MNLLLHVRLPNFVTEKDAEGPVEIALNKEVIKQVGGKVGSDWKKLAVELGFPEDDIAYFESESNSAAEKAIKVITLWQVCD